ncbi:MAG TPA: hypothetical protein VIM19_06985 [Actinomycetes bacterium]
MDPERAATLVEAYLSGLTMRQVAANQTIGTTSIREPDERAGRYRLPLVTIPTPYSPKCSAYMRVHGSIVSLAISARE